MSTVTDSRRQEPITTSYAFDNAGREAADRFDALSDLFDGGTARHMEALGVCEGWRCLEVGGGGGSVASWLSARVGPSGHVVVTDIDTRHLASLNLPNVEVRRHRVGVDPLPEAAFDLVHARLVLMHLPEREEALGSMTAALRPGGWLLVEEFDSLSMVPDSSANPAETALKTGAAMRQVLAARGVELRYGRLLPGRLGAHGLADVGAEGRVLMWRGGSAGARLMRANYEQLREEIIATGLLDEAEFARELARIDEEDFMYPSSVLWSAWGRRTVPTP